MKWSLIATDILLAGSIVLFAVGANELARELFQMPLALLLLAIIVSARILDTQ
jgi:hypothetical protein